MMDSIKNIFAASELSEHAYLIVNIALFFFLLLFVGWFTNFIAKIIIVRLIRAGLTKVHRSFAEIIIKNKVVHKLSHVIPATVIYMAAPLCNLIFPLPTKGAWDPFIFVLQKSALIYMVIAISFGFNSFLNAASQIYKHYEISKRKPISTYIQITKISVFICSMVIIISTILNKSPISFFTGLGAAMALILLIFKDVLLGFVTSIELSSYDTVRIGDWITMPRFGADGDVIEISLTTIKIRNFDKTISTVPTHALLESEMQNWRGMKEYGGRRIKRSIMIDMNTIKFCSAEELLTLSNIRLLEAYFEDKQKELMQYNRENSDFNDHVEMPLNIRTLSNVGIFRQYMIEYLKRNPYIHNKKGFAFLVRQLEPKETGLPIQIYVFTNDTNWANYEKIQADIFDHFLSALPFFNLRAFQNTSGQEFTIQLKNNKNNTLL